jgi:hypothetical protein
MKPRGMGREAHLEQRIESLKTALDLAQQRIDELECALGRDDDLTPLRLLGLTTQEARLVNLLRQRELVTKEQAMQAIYVDDPDRRFDVSYKIGDVVAFNARKKLARYGVTFGHLGHGKARIGIAMSGPDKSNLDRLIASRFRISGRRDMRVKLRAAE